ncbi:MAG TPA: divalent metal cation transporter [Gemmatimonadaceae bacterium]|jgi:NRAMP (natural resistance-associated macrophage protein)-like metal ion transporter
MLRNLWSSLGPGVVTGAADDDPSGIATYSVAGAQLGTTLLWTALITWPLMAAVQSMCARIGMVTGHGLASTFRTKFPRSVLVGVAGSLMLANTINIGADLTGMGDAMELLTNVHSHLWVIGFGVFIAWATIRLRYIMLANFLKWLALVLFAYVFTAIHLHPDWSSVLNATVIPRLPQGRAAWATLVAILGTTISPYLFFWQASQEVEEEKSIGRHTLVERRGATPAEILNRRIDIGVGTFFSNVVMFFIMLTTALTLHAHGITAPQTSKEVALALRPLAGRFASLLYTIGLVGTGLLAIPTLAGSAAYALAETFHWHEGIDELFPKARRFYTVLALSILAGVGMDFANLNAVKVLYWAAVINGLLAPFLLLGILIVASDRKIMAGNPSSRLGLVTVGLTTAAMFLAAFAMFVV